MDSIESEAFEPRQTLVNAIKNVIRDYAWEHIIREFLQNADDAGARIYRVIIDERIHTPETGDFKNMAVWQGPALLIFNDAKFKDEDFRGIQNFGEGGKQDDGNTIGRFGLGFNSCYNITDVPSVMSDGFLGFFDPHRTFLPPKNGKQLDGLKFPFNSNFLEKYPHQARPYLDIKGCSEGTIFRMPLRSVELAEASKIRDYAITPGQIREYLKDLKNHIQKYFLFLKNIEEFEVLSISADGAPSSPKLVWKAKIENMDESIREQRRRADDCGRQYPLSIKVTGDDEKEDNFKYVCSIGYQMLDESTELGTATKSSTRKVCGGIAFLLLETDKPVDETKESEKKPVKAPQKKTKKGNGKRIGEDGQLFCYFPLQESTGICAHINASWALSSDRQSIRFPTKSKQKDMDQDHLKLKWNEYILTRVLPRLYVDLLIALDQCEGFELPKTNNRRPIELFWPLSKNKQQKDHFRMYGLTVLTILPSDYPFFRLYGSPDQKVSLKKGFFCSQESVAKALAHYGCRVVYLPSYRIKDLRELKRISEDQVVSSNEARRQLKDKELATFLSADECENVLKFLMDDKRYDELKGIRLLPLKDGTMKRFGATDDSSCYYTATDNDLALFPNYDTSRLIDKSNKLYKLISDVEGDVSSWTNVKKFDGHAALLQLEKHLNPGFEIKPWDSYGGAPNKEWLNRECLNKIWDLLLKSKTDINLFKRYPILDIVNADNPADTYLVPIERNIPVLSFVHALVDKELYNSLIKLGILFTGRSIDKPNDSTRRYILEWSDVNVLTVLQMVWENEGKPKDFLKSWNSEAVNILRKLVRRNWSEIWEKASPEDRRGYGDVLKNLRMWPIYPLRDNEEQLVAPSEGRILQKEVKYYPSQQIPNIFKIGPEDNEDFEILCALGAKKVTVYEYLTVGKILRSDVGEKTELYVRFLESILELQQSEVLTYLKENKSIPNRRGKLAKPKDLFDERVELFREVFNGAPEKLLSTSFDTSRDSMRILCNIGLNATVTPHSFTSCIEYISSQVEKAVVRRLDTVGFRNNAFAALNYLYNNFASLTFSSEQWRYIMTEKFVPTAPVRETPLRYDFAFAKGGFGSFRELCLPQYVDVAWTQSPVIDENAVPKGIMKQAHPNCGKPKPERIVEHLVYVSTKLITSPRWKKEGRYAIIELTRTIYQTLSDMLTEYEGDSDFGECLEDAGPVFLNVECDNKDDDPYDSSNWKDVSELKFGSTKQEPDYIKNSLQPFSKLLQAVGVGTVISKRLEEPEYDQSKSFLKGMMELLLKGPTIHDTVFKVQGQEFYANRYVLAANGGMFERFISNSNFKPHTPLEPSIHTITEMLPRSFEIFLRFLYGMKIDDAIKNVETPMEDESDLVQVYLDILWASDYYKLDNLQAIMESRLSCHLTRVNVDDIKIAAEACEATKLVEVCDEFIQDNGLI
ncbi:7331_t:CDS:2 [Paraglomus brasilianum]|uniref:7331_t:CDS:1 n=1 Tax=Paraglomus brasilianum TaxID=144538 RepID=A0A9N9A8F6_9GLOM|nr:7331_t:CDS:2 [Paraglomus brasilianum]